MNRNKEIPKEGIIGLILCCIAIISKVLDVLLRKLMGDLIDKEVEIGAGLFGCIVTVCVFSILFQYLLPYVNSAFEADYTSRMFSSIHKAVLLSSQEDIDRKNSGEISTCFLSDVSGVFQFAKRKLTVFLPDMISFVVCTVLLVMMKPILGILTSLTGCVSVLFITRLSKSMISKMNDYQNKLKDINRLTSDGFINIEMIKVNLLSEELGKQYAEEIDKLHRIKKKIAFRQAALSIPSMILSFSTLIMIAFYGGYCVLKGQMSVGELVSAIAMSDYIVSPIMRFENTLVQQRRSVINRDNISRVLDMNQEGVDCHNFVNSNQFVLEDISFNYPDGRPVFKNTNLTFEKGSINYLVGRNGIGKTTVSKILTGVYEISEGKVIIPFDGISKENVRRMVSVMPQDTVLFSDSVIDNILVDNNFSTERFNALRKLLNLDIEINKFEEGYNTVLQENGDPLSGGQKKRLSFLRCVLHEAPIYFFDEPTSNVDKENSAIMMNFIAELAKEHYVIVITHDYGVIKKYSGRVLVVDRGERV